MKITYDLVLYGQSKCWSVIEKEILNLGQMLSIRSILVLFSSSDAIYFPVNNQLL